MALTHTACLNAEKKETQYKMGDSGGLYLLVKANGSKLWRMKYYFHRKEKLLSFGSYPLTTLAEAREERDNAKKLLKQGIDPMVDIRINFT